MNLLALSSTPLDWPKVAAMPGKQRRSEWGEVVGERLAQALEQRLNQRELAKRIGRTESVVSLWISGHISDGWKMVRDVCLEAPQPRPRLRVDGLRVTLTPEPIVAPAPAATPGTPEPLQLTPEMFAGRDLEFEAECARLQELDDLADWEAARPGSNVIPFDLARARRSAK